MTRIHIFHFNSKMDDVYEIPGLYCTLCRHDLNHNNYKICKHPVIEVPLCILCVEAIDSSLKECEDSSDICVWCGEGGDLLGCDHCERFFCRDCVSDNIGTEALHKITSETDWSCFVCDSSPLKVFSDALKYGQAQSIFNESKNVECSEEQLAVDRLNEMVAETALATKMLDNDQIKARRLEIEEDFASNRLIGNDNEVCSNPVEELELYRQYWQRHYDIILRQEADLFEQVSLYGYNPSEMACYKNNLTEDTSTAMTDEEYRKCPFPDNDSTPPVSNANKIEYVEEVVEEDTHGRLEGLKVLAQTDPTVLKYANKVDVDPSRYPPSFENVLPVGVLKALYYGSIRSVEIQELITKFEIPAHIVLIMSVADNKKEGFTDHWEIANRVHPSVRKALYELSSTVDQAIICAHYQLGEEYCSITDFGDAEDICEIYTERHSGVNPHTNEMNPKHLNELQDTEAQTVQSKLSTRQLAIVAKARRLTHPKPDASREDILQVKTIQSFETEDCDEIKLHRQRVVLSSGVKFDKSDELLEVNHERIKRRTKKALFGSPSGSTSTKMRKKNITRLDAYASLDSSSSEESYESEIESDVKVASKSVSTSTPQTKVRIKRPIKTQADDDIDDDVAVDFDDDVTVDGYWDADELKAIDTEVPPPTIETKNRNTSKKKVVKETKQPSLINKNQTKTTDTNVFDLTSDKDVDEKESSYSDSNDDSVNESSEESSDDDSDIIVIDSNEGSDVVGYGASSAEDELDFLDDEKEQDNVPKKLKSTSKSSLKRLKSVKRTLSDLEESDGSDLESPKAVKSKDVITTTITHKPSLWDKLFSKSKSGLVSLSNTFDVSGKKFELFNKPRRNRIKISKDELLATHYATTEETFALNGSKQLPQYIESVNIPVDLISKLKDHQKEGLQFLWNNTMEASFRQLNVNASKKDAGSKAKDHGCLLAHCMGLGKTFTIVCFTTTLLSNPIITSLIDSYQPPPPGSEDAKKTLSTGSSSSTAPTVAPSVIDVDVDASNVQVPKKPLIKCVLIIVPLVTVENWIIEYDKWVPDELKAFVNVKHIDANLTIKQRVETLKRWYADGGVMIMGYAMFRTLTKASVEKAPPSSSTEGVTPTFFSKKKTVPTYSADATLCRHYLMNPGPDLVVADEAHQLSNKDSKLSMAFNEMRTKRRIALTGSPLQNNLIEYFCMVEWVKKGHLAHGINRFKELFVEPIQKGDKADAHPYDVQQMRKKVFILNKKLSNIVNRKDYSILTQSLKMKRQYVLCIQMTTFQQFLYRTFLLKVTQVLGKATLFKTYQTFLRLWNHPSCVITHYLQSVKDLPANNNNSNGKTNKLNYTSKPKTPIYLKDIIREISSTYSHFKLNETKLLADMENETKDIEKSLLKPTAGLDIPEDVDDDDSDLFDQDKDVEIDEDVVESGNGDDLKRPLSQLSGLDEYEVVNDSKSTSPTSGGVKRPRSETVLNSLIEAAVDPSTMDVDTAASPGDRLIGIAVDSPDSSASPLHLNELKVNDQIVPSLNSASTASLSSAVVGRPPLPSVVKPETTSRSNEQSSLNKIHPTLPNDWWRHTPLKVETSSSSTPPSKTTTTSQLQSQPFNNNDIVDLTADDDDGDVMIVSEPVTPQPVVVDASMTEMDLLQLSNKLITFLSLLVLSIQAGDKVLMFSQSLYTLNMVEQFLKMKNWGDIILPQVDNSDSDEIARAKRQERSKFSQWYLEREYLRIDGTTKDRQTLIDKFNKSDKFKLFMVCTKAGNIGINLYSANRVIIFDSSWNPVHDLQAISRSYRYGQLKEVFVYRLVAAGSMEEVIYKRQMIKQALAARVVDAQMPDNQDTGGELMDFNSKRMSNSSSSGGDVEDKDTEKVQLSETVNQDKVLLQYVDKHSSVLSYIADQEVLLEDNIDSHLTEDQQIAAEAEYEKEVARDNVRNMPLLNQQLPTNPSLPSVNVVNPSLVYYDPTERAQDYSLAFKKAYDQLVMRRSQLGPDVQIEKIAMDIAKKFVDDKALRKHQEAAVVAAASSASNASAATLSGNGASN